MTWGEWCESAYNTEGFYPQNIYGYDLIIRIINGSFYYIITEEGDSGSVVSPRDTIIANKTYYWYLLG